MSSFFVIKLNDRDDELEREGNAAADCADRSVVGVVHAAGDALAGVDALTLSPDPDILAGEVNAELGEEHLAHEVLRQGVAEVDVLQAQIVGACEEAVARCVAILVIKLKTGDIAIRVGGGMKTEILNMGDKILAEVKGEKSCQW